MRFLGTILAVQVSGIAVLTAVAVTTGTNTLATEQGLYREGRETARRFDHLLMHAVLQAADMARGGADSRDDSLSVTTNRLRSLVNVLPVNEGSAVLTHALAEAVDSLQDECRVLATARDAATDPLVVTLALRAIHERVAGLQGLADKYADALDARASASRSHGTWTILISWLAAFLFYLATLFLAQRSLAKVQRRQRERSALASQRLARFAKDCVEGNAPPRLEEVNDLEEVRHPLEDLATRFHALREVLARERVRTGFTRDLADALELADDEEDVCGTVERAVAIAFPSSNCQLLLADNSQAALEPRFEGTAVPCTGPTPHNCPAIRRSRTLTHLPAGGMSRCPHLGSQEPCVTCAVVAVRGSSVGVLQLHGLVPGAGDVETLTTMSQAVGAKLGVARTLGERELQATTDGLTGLFNRRHMNAALDRMDRAGTTYAVVSADLDHFKKLNDTYGHDVGDRCLKVFAQVLRDGCRAGDLPCRPGGEEFALVLPGCDVLTARTVAERIHGSLATASRAAGNAFTVSLGVAGRPAHGTTAAEVLKSADQALYVAKANGRSRTEVFGDGQVAAPAGRVLRAVEGTSAG
jgi:diguanylate cyclase (GGDEF)-like protein